MTPSKHLDQRTRHMDTDELRAMLHYFLGYARRELSDSEVVELVNQAAAISEFKTEKERVA